MSRDISKYNLTKRENDIMEILWNSAEPLKASDFPKYNKELKLSTVQIMLKNLLKKKLITVADIVYSRTVLCRSYKTTINREEYERLKLIESLNHCNILAEYLVLPLIEREKDKDKMLAEIERLEKILKCKKKELLDISETQEQ